MLRITLDRESEPVRLKLEGKMSGQSLQELQRAWNDLKGKKPTQAVVVDVADVSFIDDGGEELLRSMFRQGAELQSGPLVSVARLIVNRIKRKSSGDHEIGNGGKDAFAIRLGTDEEL
jgi:hypothetical protein